ncbi:MAG: sigma-70 family RNA polymerase sigma factor [Bryobacteraceae bacterium]
MSSGKNVPDPSKPSEDELLIRECLRGSENGWSALIDKYKNLIFSIPIKLGLSRDDAAEIFQAVCLALLHDLPELKEPRALPAWLIQLTSHKCLRWKQDQRRYVGTEIQEVTLAETSGLPEQVVEEIEREQIVREALSEVSAECRRLVDLLFYSNPPVPYDEAARALGLAKGSIGATRMRCLEKLRRSLEKKGIR